MITYYSTKPPEHKTQHPLGTHRKRVDNRVAMNAIFFVLRTGCQWNALNATVICSSSSAHRRFLEWWDAGVLERFWQNGLLACEQLDAIDWSWLSMDGCITKLPLLGSKNRPQPHGSRETGGKAKSDDGCVRTATCCSCRRCKYPRHKAGCRYSRRPSGGQTQQKALPVYG